MTKMQDETMMYDESIQDDFNNDNMGNFQGNCLLEDMFLKGS